MLCKCFFFDDNIFNAFLLYNLEAEPPKTNVALKLTYLLNERVRNYNEMQVKMF